MMTRFAFADAAQLRSKWDDSLRIAWKRRSADQSAIEDRPAEGHFAVWKSPEVFSRCKTDRLDRSFGCE
jgi:hypothetical protein